MKFNKLIQLSNKKASGDLIIEIIAATIIFFVVIIIIFAIDAGTFDFEARAHVRTTDGVLQCNTNLMNILRSQTPSTFDIQNISYSQAVVYAHMNGSDEVWNRLGEAIHITSLFPFTGKDNKVDYMFNVSASEYNGKGNETIMSIGSLVSEEVTTCSVYLPLPEKLMENCEFSEICELRDGEQCIKTDDGINFTLTLSNSGPGDMLEVDIQPEYKPIASNPYGLPEVNINQITDTSDLDYFSFDIGIDDDNDGNFDDRIYHMIVIEITEDVAQVVIESGVDVSECGLTVSLTIPSSKKFESINVQQSWTDYCKDRFEAGDVEQACKEYLCRTDYSDRFCSAVCTENGALEVCQEYYCFHDQTDANCETLCKEHATAKPCITYLGEDVAGQLTEAV